MSSTNTNTVIRMGNRKLLKQVFERCDCCPNIDFEHSPLFVLLETYAAIPPSKSGKLIHALQDILFVASKADNLSKVNILMSFGQYERELVAERTRDKYVASRKRGMWMGGFVPYGYRSENKKIFPDPTEAPVVKRMFQRFVETQSPKLIAHELNQDGLTSRKKKAWVNTYVARILKNPVYVGDVKYKGEIFKGEHEAIVSRQTWNRVQEIIKSNCPYERSGGITEIKVPLKGILRCGHCGCAMIPVFCTKGKKRYYYYYCNTDYHRSEKLCPVGKIGSSIIEDAVKEQTVRIFSSTFFQETIFKATGITVAELQRIFRDEFWLECSSLELNRLYSELFEKITVHEHQLAYEIKTSGIKAVIEGIMNT